MKKQAKHLNIKLRQKKGIVALDPNPENITGIITFDELPGKKCKV